MKCTKIVIRSTFLTVFRVGDFKLIDGYPGLYPDWYPVPTSDDYNVTEHSFEHSSFGHSYLFNLKGTRVKIRVHHERQNSIQFIIK